MRSRLFLAVLPAVVIAGCGSETTFDSDKAEKEFSKGVEQQVRGAKVKSVSCPDDVELKKGTKATCDVSLEDGRKGKIRMTVQNEDGDIRWSTGRLN